VARRILDWCRPRLPRFVWGKGKETGSVSPRLDVNGVGHVPFVLYSNGLVEMPFQWLAVRPPFEDVNRRTRLLERLQAISGLDLGPDPLDRRPSFPLALLAEEASIEHFFSAIEWFIDEVGGREHLG
jgi:hypothetical protein